MSIFGKTLNCPLCKKKCITYSEKLKNTPMQIITCKRCVGLAHVSFWQYAIAIIPLSFIISLAYLNPSAFDYLVYDFYVINFFGLFDLPLNIIFL